MLRLKENPVEWIKFTAVIGLVANVIVWLIWWKDGLPLAIPVAAASIALLVLITACIRPALFRGFYRGGMTVSFHIGQVIGKILLLLIFFLFVTPLGLLLRLFGKDLLRLRPRPGEETIWQPAKGSGEFDRMF